MFVIFSYGSFLIRFDCHWLQHVLLNITHWPFKGARWALLHLIKNSHICLHLINVIKLGFTEETDKDTCVTASSCYKSNNVCFFPEPYQRLETGAEDRWRPDGHGRRRAAEGKGFGENAHRQQNGTRHQQHSAVHFHVICFKHEPFNSL